jgi:hypothetical protein
MYSNDEIGTHDVLQLSRSLLLSQQVLDIVKMMENKKIPQRFIEPIFNDIKDKRAQSKTICAFQRCLMRYNIAGHALLCHFVS